MKILGLLFVSTILFGQGQQPAGAPQQLPQQLPQQQQQLPQQQNPGGIFGGPQVAGGPQNAIPGSAERLRPTYVLREGDQIVVRAQDVEELTDRPFRVEQDGSIKLPLIGPLQAVGLTVEALEAAITQQLRRFVVNPVVVINVVQFSADPVFVIGYFRAPGIYPLTNKRTLLELLTQVGGLTPGSSRRIKITRRNEAGKIPLPGVVDNLDGKTNSVEINIASLQTSVNPAEDILLEAFDIISVDRAEMIYMAGGIGRIGAIELGDRTSLSMLQALTMSGGVMNNARIEHAVILRPILNTARRAEIAVNVKKIYRGEANDYPLLANDVLYIPVSFKKIALQQAVGIATGVATSLVFIGLARR